MLCGLWLRIICYSCLWLITSQKRNKKAEVFPAFLFSVYICIYFMTNCVHLYSNVWKSVTLIYSSNSGFMAVNNILRALTYFYFSSQENISLVRWIWWQFVGGTINSTSDLSLSFDLCVFGIVCIGELGGVGGKILAVLLDSLWNPHLTALLTWVLNWESGNPALPLSNGVVFHVISPSQPRGGWTVVGLRTLLTLNLLMFTDTS